MNQNKVIHSDRKNGHVPLRHTVYGFLLFAATWSIIQTVSICLTYHIAHGHLWLAVLADGALYFLLGLVLASLFFGCLRLWLHWRGNPSSWLMVSVGLSLLLCLLEMVLVGASLVPFGSQMSGLIVSSFLSSVLWLRSSRRKGGSSALV